MTDEEFDAFWISGKWREEIDRLNQSVAFYKRRCDVLQAWQSKMRDPERTIVCDVLANGSTLPPSHAGDRYAFDTGVKMTDYKSMFEQAVRALASIDESLGIGDDGCGDPEQTLDAITDLRAENEKLKSQVSELAIFVSRLSRQLKKAAPDNELHGQVASYLKRTGIAGSPLRKS